MAVLQIQSLWLFVNGTNSKTQYCDPWVNKEFVDSHRPSEVKILNNKEGTSETQTVNIAPTDNKAFRRAINYYGSWKKMSQNNGTIR